MCLCVVALTTGSRLFAAPLDQAQEAAPPGDSGSLIIITGSRLPRTELTAVSPVTMVNGYEFKLQGAMNAEDVLN